MSFSSRFSIGWQLAKNSFKVLRANKQLILFPILSGVAMMLLMLSFIVGLLASVGWDFDVLDAGDKSFYYIYIFLFYYLSNFIVIFFNTAMIHCTHMYFHGEHPTISAGIKFSFSRIKAILAWSLLAATVGYILRIIQENSGLVGKIITGLIGMVWGVATFFALPVIAYETGNPVQAVKKSAALMKEKWGESIGAGFNFSIFKIIAFLLVGAISFLIGSFIHPIAGIVVAVPCVLAVITIFAAAETIFVSAVYHKVHGDPVENFNDQLVDNLFVYRKAGLFGK